MGPGQKFSKPNPFSSPWQVAPGGTPVLPPANAMLWPDGTPMLWPDGEYMLWPS